MSDIPKGWEIMKLGKTLNLEYCKPLPDEKRAETVVFLSMAQMA